MNQSNSTLANHIADLERQLSNTKNLANNLLEENKQLIKQNTFLAAQVEAFSNKLQNVAALVDGDGFTAVQWILDNHAEISQLVATTPQHHLCQVRADAVLQFAKQYKNKYEMVPATASPTVVEFANQYAAGILAGKE